jgi:uncharacterized protein (DUF1330 family)
MRAHRFEILLFAALLAAFLGFFLWQSPALWRSALTPAEIDRYAAAMHQHLLQPPAEKAAFIARLREWAASDDGRPVLLLNLMRYHEQLGALPPSLDPQASPLEANATYEARVAALALKRGEYPLVGGAAQAQSLTPLDPATDRWDRVVVMRAPSRRAFIEFMADPAYGPNVPYKMAAADVVLIPLDAELSIPDLRWPVGGLLLTAFLSIGWYRAERRSAR